MSERHCPPAHRVLIADDWPLFRLAMRQILRTELGAVQVTEGPLDGDLIQLHGWPWDLVIAELYPASPHGQSFLEALKRFYPEQRVIITGLRANRAAVQVGFPYGVSLLARESEVEEARHVVRNCFHKARDAMKISKPRVVPPTVRELEVLQLLAAGLSHKQVAATLTISVQTVATHRARLLRKLDLNSTAELIRYALFGGLID